MKTDATGEQHETYCGIDVVDGIPDWATTFICYGDASGLSSEDEAVARRFLEELASQGMEPCNPIESTANEFNRYPAFGLACATHDWTVRKCERRSDGKC